MQRQRVAHPNDSVAQDIDITELEDFDDAQEEFLVDSTGWVVPDSEYNSAEMDGDVDDINTQLDDDDNQIPALEPHDHTETETELMEGGPIEGARSKKI